MFDLCPWDNSTTYTSEYRFGLRYSFRCDDTQHPWTMWFRSPANRDAFARVLRPFVTGGAFEELHPILGGSNA
jgi:hypothetical protein